MALPRKITIHPAFQFAYVFSLSFMSRATLALVALTFAVPIFAQLPTTVAVPLRDAATIPVAVTSAAAPAVSASAYIVVEATSGRVLAERNTRERREPASLTKLMTAYLVFEALHQKRLSLSQTVHVSERAWKAEGSRMFIQPGKSITTEELLRGLIIQSGNDAAITLAIAVSGTESGFVNAMNREAKRLGMSDTQFLNPTGLPAQGHYSTAHDLAVLSLALMRDFPQYTRFYAEKTFTYNRITQENRNRLLFLDPTVDGLKTGHTDAAGWCLIATANRPPRKVLTVVLGAPNDAARISESRNLIEWAFAAFEGKRMFEAKKAVATLRVWKSDVNAIPVGFNDDVTAVADTGKLADLTAEIKLDERKLAPILAGDKVGTLLVKRAGSLVYERDVVAMEPALSGSIWKRAWHSVVLWWKGVF